MPPPKDKRQMFMAEGVIADVECHLTSSGRITLTVDHSSLKFIYSNLARVDVVEGLKEDSGLAPACANWRGRRARLFFCKTNDKPYAGEVKAVQFF